MTSLYCIVNMVTDDLVMQGQHQEYNTYHKPEAM